MSKLGDDIIQGLSEALAHARGKDVPGMVIHHVDIDAPDLKAIRERLNLSQEKMAPLLGVSLSGYRKWEQGKRTISGPAKTLITIMEKEPEAVVRALLQAS